MTRARDLAVGLLLFGMSVALQMASGAYSNEFGGHPDEAGHYITGLMVRDFLLSRHWHQPMQFAEDYYIHYPKVALGHWPPFFYMIQAGWTTLFSPSRASVLLLMAVITTLLAWSLYAVVRTESGVLMGGAVAILLIALPITQRLTGQLTCDPLVAILVYWAVLVYGR